MTSSIKKLFGISTKSPDQIRAEEEFRATMRLRELDQDVKVMASRRTALEKQMMNELRTNGNRKTPKVVKLAQTIKDIRAAESKVAETGAMLNSLSAKQMVMKSGIATKTALEAHQRLLARQLKEIHPSNVAKFKHSITKSHEMVDVAQDLLSDALEDVSSSGVTGEEEEMDGVDDIISKATDLVEVEASEAFPDVPSLLGTTLSTQIQLSSTSSASSSSTAPMTVSNQQEKKEK